MLCLHWVDKGLEAHEEFIGLHQIESTASTVLVGVIHDVLIRLVIALKLSHKKCLYFVHAIFN